MDPTRGVGHKRLARIRLSAQARFSSAPINPPPSRLPPRCTCSSPLPIPAAPTLRPHRLPRHTRLRSRALSCVPSSAWDGISPKLCFAAYQTTRTSETTNSCSSESSRIEALGNTQQGRTGADTRAKRSFEDLRAQAELGTEGNHQPSAPTLYLFIAAAKPCCTQTSTASAAKAHAASIAGFSSAENRPST